MVNLALVAMSRSGLGRPELLRRAAAAVRYVEDVSGRSVGDRFTFGNGVLYNSNPVDSVWNARTVIENPHRVIGFSQPPVVIDQDVPAAAYDGIIGAAVDAGAFDRFLPNHFGTVLSTDGSVTAWSDVFGFARGYYVATERFVAASNHIGALAFFLDSRPQMDGVAWGLRSMFGWFAGHRSTLKQIRSLPMGSRLDVAPNGIHRVLPYADHSSLLGARESAPDYEYVAAELQQVSLNVGRLAAKVPRVFLSGGQDSRMSAAAWLASGAPAEVLTYGTLRAEADVAGALMESFWEAAPERRSTVSHDVRIPSPTAVTMSMEARVAKAHELWDGDFAVNLITRNVSTGPNRGRLSIGGMGGELMHGYFYLAEDMLEKVQALPSPVDRLHQVFRGQSTAQRWIGHGAELIDDTMDRIAAWGHSGATALDVFYLMEKYRRWPNSRLYSSAVIPLATPAFVRAAFDMTPVQRLAKEGQRAVANHAVPGWGDVPYYKGVAKDAKTQVEQHGLRLWQKDPDAYAWIKANNRVWPEYVREDRIASFMQLIDSGEGQSSHESWMHQCILLETFPSHLCRLGDAIHSRTIELNDEEVSEFWRGHA